VETIDTDPNIDSQIQGEDPESPLPESPATPVTAEPQEVNPPQPPQSVIEPPTKPNSKPLLPIVVVVFLILALIGFLVYKFYVSPQKNNSTGVTPLPAQETTSVSPTSTEPPILQGNDLSEAHNNFGLLLLKELSKAAPNKNVIISPTSIELDFSMVVNGAGGDTLTALKKTLALANISNEKMNDESLTLIDYLKNPDPKVELSIANSIWARSGVNFLEDFLNTNKKYYNAWVQTLDFDDPKSVTTINNWVSQNTKGKIPTIVSPPIQANQVMFLINAIYFKGQWAKTFDPDLTQSDNFTLSDGSQIQTDFMSQKGDFDYLEDNDFQMIRLAYGESEDLAMYVFLPKGSIDTFLGNITFANWKTWEGKLGRKEGTIILPKYKLEYDSSLVKVLSTMGMSNAFSPGADFSGIAPNLYISDVIHKTYVEVNEEGTTAAAATSIGMAMSALPQNDSFTMDVNKPFFFTIEDTKTGEIIFCGVIYDPSG
jgi:serine protease inhibitor